MSGRDAAKRQIKRLTKTQRAGIIFPVSRVLRFMRTQHFGKYRIAAGAPVYTAAVMEYLCAEVRVVDIVIFQFTHRAFSGVRKVHHFLVPV